MKNNDIENKEIPAYFLSISLKNIKCFKEEQTLKLSDENGKPFQWTIIIGNNGVGKTTLLQCLANIAPVNTNSLKSPIAEAKIFSKKNQNHKLFISYKKVVGVINTNIGYNVKISENKTSIKSHFDLKFQNNTISTNAWDTNLKYPYSLICYAYGASRKMSSSSLIEKTSVDADESLFSDEAVLRNPEEWFLQMDYFAIKESNIKEKAIEQRDKVKNILLNLLPDIKDIVFKIPNEEFMKPQIMFVTHYGEVSLKELSLGYKSMITWVVDLASRLFERYKDSENPIAEPAVVLIDELDLHLHPSWQRKIINFLTKNFVNTQFIVTAHSPLIVQSATNANIVLLKREGDHVIIDNTITSIKNWRVDQILTSDLFGIDTSRPPYIEEFLNERKEILSKGKLTKKDKEKLKELEEKIGSLPVGQTKEEIQAMDIILRYAKELEKNDKANKI